MPLAFVWRLLLSAGFGAALGLEREYRRKPAGLRTNILIALGSAIFTIMSIQLGHAGGTPDRIAAQQTAGRRARSVARHSVGLRLDANSRHPPSQCASLV